MRTNIKSFVTLFVLSLVMFSGINSVSAITISGGSYINFNNYGLKVSSGTHYRTSYKTSSGNEAYCVQFTKNFTDGSYTESNCKTNKITDKLTDYDYLVAGQIVDIVDAKSWDKNKKHAYKVAALNTYMSGKLSGASTFNKKSSSEATKEINDILTKAKSNASGSVVNSVLNSKILSTPSISVDSSTMGQVGTIKYKFISQKVTFKNLSKDKINGVTPTYSFSISNAAKGITYYLCTSTNWNTCQTYDKVTVSGKESVSYYVRAQNESKQDVPVHTFKISIKGTAPGVKYTTSKVYCKGTTNQAVLLTSSATKDISVSKSLSLKVPSDDPGIEIEKVDESGNDLTGAEFKLYTVDNSGKKTEITLEKSGNTFKHVFTDKTTVAGKYYLEETKAPDGYLIAGGQEFEITGTTSSACYNADGEKVTDTNYCNDNIKSVCKITTTTTAEDGTTSTGDTYSDDVSNCVTQTETEPNVVKEKICAKVDNNTYTAVDSKYCDTKDDYTSITVDGKSILISKVNTKNRVVISKKATNGNDEVEGAKLKICTEADYKKSGDNCSATKTVNNVTLSWTSGASAREFNGIKPGTYYIVEVTPPSGYKVATVATEFKVDANGTVTTGGKAVSDDTIVIENAVNGITISKVDMATTKELPGANLSICTTVTSNIDDTEGSSDSAEDTNATTNKGYIMELDSDGNCIPATLSDGSSATWTSGDKPHIVSGLPAGTYYLVETTAPKGYATAESILFTLKEDGTLTDVNGNSLANNKLVMKDSKINDVKTGITPMIVVSGMVVAAAGVLGYYFFVLNHKTVTAVGNSVNGVRKVKSRKIHK